MRRCTERVVFFRGCRGLSSSPYDVIKYILMPYEDRVAVLASL